MWGLDKFEMWRVDYFCGGGKNSQKRINVCASTFIREENVLKAN